MKFFKTTLLAAVLATLGLTAVNAQASQATGSFTVSLTVSSTCQVNTTGASNITFPGVTAGTTPASASGVFSVNCSNGTPYNVGLAPSSGNTDGTGVLSSGATTIAYGLFQDASTSTVWGNTATASSVGNGEAGTGAGMAVGNAHAFTVYSKVTGSTDVPPNTYTDTVAINVNY